MSATPLAGLRVLEFSHTVMGPTAGLILAELGADVIKVEPAPRGDHTRFLGGFAAGFFAAFSRNKRSLAVDLAGPYEHRPALDEVVQFQTGLAFMTGPVGQPLRAGASVTDILGAVFGVVAAQAALRERDKTGVGQRVGSSLFESAAFLMSTHMAGMTATGLEARPMPARRGAWAIYEVFKTAGDGQLFIGVTSDQQWARFVEEFSLQELAADPRLATNFMRLQERTWLIPALQDALMELPQMEVETRCERANVSWARVGKPGDLFIDPHLLASGGLLDVFVSRTGGSEGKKVGLPALPMEFGSTRDRPGIRRQSPRMGEHSREVLREAGYSVNEIENLIGAGTVVAWGG